MFQDQARKGRERLDGFREGGIDIHIELLKSVRRPFHQIIVLLRLLYDQLYFFIYILNGVNGCQVIILQILNADKRMHCPFITAVRYMHSDRIRMPGFFEKLLASSRNR